MPTLPSICQPSRAATWVLWAFQVAGSPWPSRASCGAMPAQPASTRSAAAAKRVFKRMELQGSGAGEADQGVAQDGAVGLVLQCSGPDLAGFALLALGPEDLAQVRGDLV